MSRLVAVVLVPFLVVAAGWAPAPAAAGPATGPAAGAGPADPHRAGPLRLALADPDDAAPVLEILRGRFPDAPVEVLAATPQAPVRNAAQARAFGQAAGADVVLWGTGGGDGAPVSRRLAVLRSLDPAWRDGTPGGGLAWSPALVAAEIDGLPCDAAADLGPWPGTPGGTDSVAATIAALALLDAERFEQALWALGTVPDPRPEQLFYRGVVLLRMDRPEGAEHLFRQVLADRPDHVGARVGLLEARVRSGPDLLDPATRDLVEDLDRTAPTDFRASIAVLGWLAAVFREGDLRRDALELAEGHLERVCAAPDADAMAASTRRLLIAGMLLADAHDPRHRFLAGSLSCPALIDGRDDASAEARQVVCLLARAEHVDAPGCAGFSLDPYRARPMLYAAFLHEENGRSSTSDRLAELLRTAEADPRLPERLAGWALALGTVGPGGPAAAARFLDEHLAAAEHPEEAWSVKGLVLLLDGKIDEARQAVEKGASRGTPRGPLRRLLGQVRLLAGDPDGALEAFGEEFPGERALAHAVRGELARAYDLLRRTDAASDARVMFPLARLVEKDPRLAAALGDELLRELREQTIRAGRIDWQLGMRVTREGPVRDPVRDPGLRSEPVDDFSLPIVLELPRTPRELIAAVAGLAGRQDRAGGRIDREAAREWAGRLEDLAAELEEEVVANQPAHRALAARLLPRKVRRAIGRGRIDDVRRQFASRAGRATSTADVTRAAAFALFAGDAREAAELCRDVIEHGTPDLPLLEVAAAAMLELGRVPTARALVDGAMQRDGADPEVLLLAAEVAARSGDAARARALLDEATGRAPEDPLAWEWRAEMLVGYLGDPAAGVEAARKAVELFPRYTWARRWLAEGLRRAGDDDGALAQLRAIEEVEPPSSWVLYTRGWIEEGRGRYESAAELFRQALALNRKYGDAWAELGNSLAETGDLAGAERALRTAIGYGADDAWTRATLGRVLRLAGRLPEAEEVLRAAVQQDPRSPRAWDELGWTLAAEGKEEEARRCFERCVAVQGARSWCRRELADFEIFGGRPDRAERVLREAAKEASNPAEANLLATRFAMIGRPEAARELLEAALREHPDDREVRLALARIHRLRGKPREAAAVVAPVERDLLAARREGRPFAGEDRVALAFAQALAGRGEEARETVRRYLATGPELTAADHYELACVLALAGDADGALAQLEKALHGGYREVDWMRHDPDLAGLRDDPRFEELLRRYE